MWLRDFGVLSERRHKIPWVSYHTFCCSVRFKERFTLRFKMCFTLSPTADWDSRKVLRRFQKVLGRIRCQNQNHKRPFVYYTGYPPRPRCVLCGRTRTRAYVCARAYMRVWAHAHNACVCIPMTRVPHDTCAPMPMPTRPTMRLSHVAHARPGMAARSAHYARATRPAWHVRAAPDTCRLWA